MYTNEKGRRKYPTIPCPGGKGRLAPTLIQHFPPTAATYVEPCAGRGNMFWVAASTMSYGSWLLNDPNMAYFLRAVRDSGDLITVPERTKEEYYRQWERAKIGDDVSVILEPYLTRNGGGYGISGPCAHHNGPSQEGYAKTLLDCERLLNKTKARITSRDWQDIGLEDLTADDMVFFDPPAKGADIRAYNTVFDHNAMVEVLKDAKFKWLLTEYDQEFYREHLGAPALQFNVQHMGNNATGQRIESVWRNY